MKFTVYVEGGGDSDRLRKACRQAFGELLSKALQGLPKPRIYVCGGRTQAFKDFQTALTEKGGDFALLLVDSEEAVAGSNAWQHLQKRDGWKRPDGVTDDQAHLMAQCMETWLLADFRTLRNYYAKDFRESALPQNAKIEQIPKDTVMDGLERASAETTKGVYHKTRHGFEILSLVDPATLRARSPFADRFFATLETLARNLT